MYVFGQQVQGADPAVVGARIFSIAFIFSPLACLFVTPIGPPSFEGFMGLAGCCLSLALRSFLMFYSVASAGTFKNSLFVKLEPAFTGIFSYVLLHQILNGGLKNHMERHAPRGS